MSQIKPERRVLVLLLALASFLSIARVSAMGQASANLRSTTIDMAVTYDAVHARSTGSSSFWMKGGGIELHGPFYRGFGFTASATGLHAESTGPLTVPLDLVTIVFGPRYTLHSKSGGVSIFCEALGGEAHGFHSVFSTGSGPASNPLNGTTDRANALAFQAGAGIDLKLNHALAIRLIQADYLRTQLPNGQSNTQNNTRLGIGMVLRLGS